MTWLDPDGSFLPVTNQSEGGLIQYVTVGSVGPWGGWYRFQCRTFYNDPPDGLIPEDVPNLGYARNPPEEDWTCDAWIQVLGEIIY